MSNVNIKNTQSNYRKLIIDEIGEYFSLKIISNFTNFSSKIKGYKIYKIGKKLISMQISLHHLYVLIIFLTLN